VSKPFALASIFLFLCIIGILFVLTTKSPQEERNKKNHSPTIKQQHNEPKWSETESASAEKSLPVLPFTLSENDTDSLPNPLPAEWEDSFFDILNNSKSREERNSRLYLFASTTAQTSPRVQEECLAHLSFGLQNTDKEFALQILKDLRISESARLLMFKNIERIRPDEFVYFLVLDLSTTLPDSELKKVSKQTLFQFEYKATTDSQRTTP
jgi:hypothetical protein